MNIPETELQTVRDLLMDQLHQIEVEGRSVHAFASALLLASSELYGEAFSGGELRAAFAQIAIAESVASGQAGRA